MAYHPGQNIPLAEARHRDRYAIVGVGETDYREDYQAAREAAKSGVQHQNSNTVEVLAERAFHRALNDSGLSVSDIDGLGVSFLYGGYSAEEMASQLGVAARCTLECAGIMAGPIPQAVSALERGECHTIALIYGVASRSKGRRFGGQVHQEDLAPSSYYYHHPWGWSSQAAHWALAWQHYRTQHTIDEHALAAVSMQLRAHALMTDNSIMHKPLTREAYEDSRYIVWPLHLFDICLVNDGAVCLIIRRSDQSRDLAKTPVLISGWGEATVTQDKMKNLIAHRMFDQFQAAGQQALDMAGITRDHIQHFECYDASSAHLVNHLEGHGFAAPGETIAGFENGEFGVGGRLPVNTAGGMLSGSYMHGWNHVAEIVHQLRHEAGARQTPGVETAMFSLAQTDQVHPLVFRRGEQI